MSWKKLCLLIMPVFDAEDQAQTAHDHAYYGERWQYAVGHNVYLPSLIKHNSAISWRTFSCKIKRAEYWLWSPECLTEICLKNTWVLTCEPYVLGKIQPVFNGIVFANLYFPAICRQGKQQIYLWHKYLLFCITIPQVEAKLGFQIFHF